jgi:putative transposase
MVIRKRLKISSSALAYVTTTVRNWHPIFTQEGTLDLLLKQLAEMTEYFKVSIKVYCLMPSHLHAILNLSDIRILSDLMGGFKSISSKMLKKEFPELFIDHSIWGDHFHLWKSRFDDFIIRNMEQFRIKMDYIHENPVRAGLVKRAADWKYSSASDWLLNKRGLIEIDKEGIF